MPNLTPTKSLTPTSSPRCASPALEAAIETPTEGAYGEHGFDLRPAPWQPPAAPPDALRSEAGRAADSLDAALATDATTGTVTAWLGTLGALVAGGHTTPTDAAMRLSAYARMLAPRYPAPVWSEDAIDRVARACKWFPTYAELTEHLDRELGRLRVRAARLRKVATAEPGPKPDAAPGPPIDEAARRAAVAEALAALTGGQSRDSPGNGEADRASLRNGPPDPEDGQGEGVTVLAATY